MLNHFSAPGLINIYYSSKSSSSTFVYIAPFESRHHIKRQQIREINKSLCRLMVKMQNLSMVNGNFDQYTKPNQ